MLRVEKTVNLIKGAALVGRTVGCDETELLKSTKIPVPLKWTLKFWVLASDRYPKMPRPRDSIVSDSILKITSADISLGYLFHVRRVC